MAYESTFNDPVDAGSGNQTWNIDPWLYSARVRVWGGGGGGEYVNPSNLVATAGNHGGNSSIFGVNANGGLGGGRRANGTTSKNVGGDGGTTTLTNVPDWSSLGVAITRSNGSRGTLSSGGAAGRGGGGAGGDASPGSRTYTSYSYHEFNNDTNEHVFLNTSSDISVFYANPASEVTGSPDRPTNGKHYVLSFIDSFLDNNWSFEVYSVCNQAAGGSTGNPTYSYSGYRNKTKDGISLWFQTGTGGNTYIRCFSFNATGIKPAARGRGGGGAGFAEFNLTRQNLIDAGYNMNPYESDNVTQRAGDLLSFVVGSGGSSSYDNGDNGRVTIHWYEIPQVYLSTNRPTIIVGGSAILSWYTLGDASSITFIEGNVDNQNLTSQETVSPSVTTTYTAQATGLGGSSFNNEATVTIIVYQIPEITTFEVPVEINYGTETIQVEYAARYCDISLEVTVRYSYDFGPNAGLGIIDGETISIDVDNVSPEYNEPNSIVEGTLDINLPWTEFGPSFYYISIEALGSGGLDTDQKTITVIIDRKPDNLGTLETLELDKDQEPVITPGVEVVEQGLLVNDIDIPVEVKSNYPIQVAINDLNNWTNVREL